MTMIRQWTATAAAPQPLLSLGRDCGVRNRRASDARSASSVGFHDIIDIGRIGIRAMIVII